MARFCDKVEVHVVPNVLITYSMSPRELVFGKKGIILKLTRQFDPFTGVLKSEVKDRRKKMSQTCRWTLRGKHRRVILDVINSELGELFADQNAVPMKAAITKPRAKAGPKRSGARATKKLEQLQSKGHVLDPEEATAYRGLSARGNYLC